MKSEGIPALLVIGGIVLVTGLGFFIHAMVVADKATVGKVEQRVDTENYEQSVAFREGTRRDFDELVLSYKRAKGSDEKQAVLSVMRHRAAGAPPELVPQDVKDLLRESERGDW